MHVNGINSGGESPTLFFRLLIYLFFSYLDKGFPLKSTTVKALQNFMLSGISIISENKNTQNMNN